MFFKVYSCDHFFKSRQSSTLPSQYISNIFKVWEGDEKRPLSALKKTPFFSLNYISKMLVGPKGIHSVGIFIKI
jgi:hypothetical protein